MTGVCVCLSAKIILSYTCLLQGQCHWFLWDFFRFTPHVAEIQICTCLFSGVHRHNPNSIYKEKNLTHVGFFLSDLCVSWLFMKMTWTFRVIKLNGNKILNYKFIDSFITENICSVYPQRQQFALSFYCYTFLFFCAMYFKSVLWLWATNHFQQCIYFVI